MVESGLGGGLDRLDGEGLMMRIVGLDRLDAEGLRMRRIVGSSRFQQREQGDRLRGVEAGDP